MVVCESRLFILLAFYNRMHFLVWNSPGKIIKRRITLPKEAKKIMRKWLYDHRDVSIFKEFYFHINSYCFSS